MFSSAINAVNGNGSAIGNVGDSSSTNKSTKAKGVPPKFVSGKIYMGDRHVKGKFMPAGYY